MLGWNITLGPNEISINQKEDTEVLYHETQDVIDSVRKSVHRYHAKQKDGVLYATQLDDTNSARYVDGQQANVSNVDIGDTLTYIPGFYATLIKVKNDISVYRFSNQPVNENSFLFGDIFVGSYGGDFTGERLNSLSHPSTTTGTYRTKDQIESMAASKGAGYFLSNIDIHNLVGLLYVAIYHNTDCKGTLGTGASTENRPCGTSTQYGIADSKPGDVYTNFLGIENWWGGRYELVGKIVANSGKVDGVYHVTELDGSTREIQSLAPLSQWLYPRKMILGKRFDIIADPSCYQGEITSGHGWNSEQYMRNEADRVVIRGGYQADISSGFAFLAARFTNTESGSFSTITGRLAYKGKYKFVDANEYRIAFDASYFNRYYGGHIIAVVKRQESENVRIFNEQYAVAGDVDLFIDNKQVEHNNGTYHLNDTNEHKLIIGFHEGQQSLEKMFMGLNHYISLDFNQFSLTDEMTSLQETFANCKNITTIQFGGSYPYKWNNITSVKSMCKNCINLKTFKPYKTTMESLICMDEMFMNCQSITDGGIILSRTVTSARYAYYGCTEIKKGSLIYPNSMNIGSVKSKIRDTSHAYEGCTNMEVFGNKYEDMDLLEDASYMFNGCSSLNKVCISRTLSDPNLDTTMMFNGVAKNGEYRVGAGRYHITNIKNAIPDTWEVRSYDFTL